MNVKWLLRVYPRAWRRRYGEEFVALLEDAGTSPRTLVDAVLGAVDAHLRPQVASTDVAHPVAVEGPPTDVTANSDLIPASSGFAGDRRRTWMSAPGEWESVLDRIIRQAQDNGEFDNLPGTGKPLNLEENPFDTEWAMAHRILKQAGETLPWIVLGREIEDDKRRLELLLETAAARLRDLRASAWSDPRGDRHGEDRYEAEWQRYRARYLEMAAALDEKLAAYNQQAPSWRLDRGRVPETVAARRFAAACPPAAVPVSEEIRVPVTDRLRARDGADSESG